MMESNANHFHTTTTTTTTSPKQVSRRRRRVVVDDNTGTVDVDVPPSTEEDSYIKRKQDGTGRRGKIVSLLGISRPAGNSNNDDDDDHNKVAAGPDMNRLNLHYTLFSVFLAIKELQTKSGRILPNLPQLLEGCDMEWEYEARDTNYLPLQAVEQLLAATGTETEAEYESITGHHSASELLFEEDNDGDDQDEGDNNNNNNNNNNNGGEESGGDIIVEHGVEDEGEVVLLTEEESEGIIQTTTQQIIDHHHHHQQQQQLPQDDVNSIQSSAAADSAPRTVPPRTIPPIRTLPPKETDPSTLLTQEEQYVFDDDDDDRGNRGLKRQRRTLQNDNDIPKRSSRKRRRKRRRTVVDDDHHLIPLNNGAFGMIGDFSSRVSDTLSILGNALSVPQLSGSSTSRDLNDSPLFARTINTDDGKAEAFIRYMEYLNISHVANIYVNDPYGNSFSQSLTKYADLAGITIRTISYNIGQEMETINNLRETRYRIVIATIIDFEQLVKVAYQQGVMGVPDYVWYMAEKFFLTSPTYKVLDPDVAHALSGIGLINVYQKIHPALDRALIDFANNNSKSKRNNNNTDPKMTTTTRTTLQKEFIASHAHPEIFDNYTFVPHVSTNAYEYLFFDAVVALGLASCRTPGLFTGKQLYQQLLQLEFEGVTGLVTFDEFGNRAFEGLQYRVDNIVLRKRTTSNNPSATNRSGYNDYDDIVRVPYRFDSTLTTILEGNNVTKSVDAFLYNNDHHGGGGGPFQFTTTMPNALPPVEENFNFISKWAKGLGLALGSSIVFLSLLLMGWTWRRRKRPVIRAAQPPFLIQLCCGTLVYSCAIYPMSLGGGGPDEESNPWKYDTACMSSIWLIFIGFVISFSAILAKTLRLNKIMNSGRKSRRVKIKAKDVMKPFISLMIINVMGLLSMTFLAPFQFQRNHLEHNQDIFGRTVESYGTCVASSNLFWAFLAPIAIANSVGVMWAIRQCYIARDLPMDFSETHYLGVSMAILVETIIISSPMLIALRTKPTAYFVFSTIAICFLCLSILIPVFLPKWIHRKRKENLGRAQTNLIAAKTRIRRRVALHNASTISGLGKNRVSGLGTSTISGLGSPSTVTSRALIGSSGFPSAIEEEASRDGSSVAISEASSGLMILRHPK